VPTEQKTGWKMTAEQFAEHMTPRTKMLILNSPSNPTGAVHTREELEAIAEVAVSEEIVVLSDEIYEKLIYGDLGHVSIASLGEEIKELSIVVNGFSKAYAMTGWRLGYTAAPKAIARAIDTIQSHTTSAPATFAQYGGLAALAGDQTCVQEMKEEFDLRRQYMLNRLQRIANVSTVEPLGAFYFLVNIRKTQIKSVNFSDKLLSRHKVAVVPGEAFGDDHTVRFSYATSLDIIKEGLDHFEDFCRSF
jgi:aspartate aminotransferase